MTDTTPTTGPDDERPQGEAPNPDTGVGIGAGEGTTFEPEEDADTSPDAGSSA